MGAIPTYNIISKKRNWQHRQHPNKEQRRTYEHKLHIHYTQKNKWRKNSQTPQMTIGINISTNSLEWKKPKSFLRLKIPNKSATLAVIIVVTLLVSGNVVHAAERFTSPKQKNGDILNIIPKDNFLPGYAIGSNDTDDKINDNSNEISLAQANPNTTKFETSSKIYFSTHSNKIDTIKNNKGISEMRETTIGLTEENRNGPNFDKSASKNVTALLGKTAYLICRVKNLGNKTMLLQVSWVRHRDIHLLTVGRYTYTSDQRFRAIHQPQTEDWILQIKYPQHRDSGIYECQVSTTPHMSHYIYLNVVEPSTEIIGAPDMYIESGSTINLTCVILNSPEPPAYIFWNHNSAIINYDSPRGGVSVITNKGETTTSFLLIKSARPSDSGQYQCNPSNSRSKGVTVHVLNGVSHSVSREIPSSNAARGTSTPSNVSKSLSIGPPINIFIYYRIYQTVSMKVKHHHLYMKKSLNSIIKPILFCTATLLIKSLHCIQHYTTGRKKIFDLQTRRQYQVQLKSNLLQLFASFHHQQYYHRCRAINNLYISTYYQSVIEKLYTSIRFLVIIYIYTCTKGSCLNI